MKRRGRWHRWMHRDPFKHMRCRRCSDVRWAWSLRDYVVRLGPDR